MSALVKKEIRLLLPVWGMALLLAVVAPWLDSYPGSFGGTELALFFGGAVILAVASFGREFSLGTFSFLLAQPVDRRRFWWTKASVLAATFALMLAAFCISFQLRANAILANPVWQDKFYADTMSAFRLQVWNEPYLAGVLGFMAFAGGLWAVLLLRQVAAAFWVAALVPAFIGLGVSWMLTDCGPVLFNAGILYSIAGLWWAWRLFQRAEDAAWTGMAATLPVWRFSIARYRSTTGPRRRSPLAALIGKELQLHHTTLLCAVGLLVLHFGVIALRKAGHDSAGHDSFGWATRALLEGFYSVWLAVPLIIGCSAVAEERRLGTLEEHLCLPVSSCVQFSVKLFVTLLLGVLLGAVLPLAVENLGILLGVDNKIFRWQFSGDVFHSQGLPMLFAALAIAGIAFFVSTLTQNILQSLATSVAMIIAVALIFAAIVATVNSSTSGWILLWGRRLGTYFLWTLMIAWIVTAIWLAYGNFKHLHRGWRIWLRNILSLAAVLVLLAVFTTALYHRVWEYLTPLEPPHDPARITGAKPDTHVSWGYYSVAIQLPDGRFWRDFAVRPIDYSEVPELLHFDPLTGNPFVGGSNWTAMTITPFGSETVGIQSDGSLWVSETLDKRIPKSFPWGRDNVLAQPPAKLVRYGDETNWQSVARLGVFSVLLLKTDGTLWWWGITNRSYRADEWPGLRAFIPRRLGTESNWVEIIQDYHRTCLRKTDGSVWTARTLSDEEIAKGDKPEIMPGRTLESVTSLESGKWSSTTVVWLGRTCLVGVRSDGTFRVRAYRQSDSQSRPDEWTATDLQIGGETNWLAVAGRGEHVVTLKRDGSLWLWNFQIDRRRGWDIRRFGRELAKKIPVQLGTHSDWVAIGSTYYGIVSLAADGSLWYWQFDGPDESQSWLATSRKPLKLVNIFEASATAAEEKP